ncbi:MAG: EF-hand domain-containing protein, partial [Myxococcota bacterium]
MNGINGGGLRQAILQRLDANKDGVLDREELQKFADALSERTGRAISVDRLLEFADGNGDGIINMDDARQRRIGGEGYAGRSPGMMRGNMMGP